MSNHHTLQLSLVILYIEEHTTTIQCGTSWRYVLKKDKLFQGLPNVFGIADDILIVGFDGMDRDHNATLDKVQTGKSEAEQRQVYIQVCQLWGG